MIRYYEYTDENGKRWGAAQNAPDATRQKANELLAHLAKVKGWKDVEVFPANMPDHEVKRRINAIQQQNNEPPLYDEAETKPPELRKTSIITLTDHQDGATIQSPIVATSPAIVMKEPLAGEQAIPITDHADPEPARG